ncbi:ATP-dependent Clp protease proteolytic subunit [Actinopolymorpha pittospori]|uniref:ATP-dependent Clp protease proteolytic subunit n=1 Tax=Actinopolymorpha pittospori TaxID=648752 RepID=A0A927N2N0_9ACTN|nr:ATP-dependent Clp protease proteolytic subunit [Actinopolymorpha pittospori]MBE1610949.1 ATP-dependent Clp protease protease subunit [Actinopolymorpha pittospori]
MRDDRMTFDTYIQEQLFERRIVVAQGFLDDECATRTAARLLTLEAMDGSPIRLHLSCPGGTFGAALSLADTLRVLRAELTAVAVGEVSGAAVGALAAAPRRTAYPHARFQLSEPKVAEIKATASEVDTYAKEHLRQRDALVELLSEATGRQGEAVLRDLRAGRFLTAQEAVGYGLVQEVVSGRPVT